MRDHDDGLAGHEPLESELDEMLVFWIGKCGRFVKHHDGTVGQDCPGNGDALGLSAREVHALAAIDGVVSLG